MKKIALFNLEPNLKNLALEKIRLFYQLQGYIVEDYMPLYHNYYEKIYCSSIFKFTKKFEVMNDMVKGGTGFNLITKLPEEIDVIKPKLNFGFTTRGCIRKCSFCVVPEKEGKINIVGDIYDLWDGKSKELILFDNNILALPEHFKNICSQLRKEKLRVDFNQGLDIRLLTEDIVKELKTIKKKGELRFAFDDIKLKDLVIDKIELLRKYEINRSFFYVLVGYNTSFEEDMERIEILKKLNQTPFVMKYETIKKDRQYVDLANYVNQSHIFKKMSFEEFIELRRDRKKKWSEI